MISRNAFPRIRSTAATLLSSILAICFLTSAAQASSEKVLYAFSGTPDGFQPTAGVIFDAAGNLYGTTYLGGAFGYGMVFELVPVGDGTWSETILYSFSGAEDGANPQSALVMDAVGNLYGTTLYGGVYGLGTAFELSPGVGGGWTETVIHSFGNNDGILPWSSMVFDTAGNLYGTTTNGGTTDSGTVYELSPSGSGWTSLVLYNFLGGNDGAFPFAPITFDSAGNIYGTTRGGGAASIGTVFRLSPVAGGRWKEKLLHVFSDPTRDGGGAFAGVTMDASGNIYGATYGETATCGSVYELLPSGARYTFKVLHRFPGATGGGSDGCQPYGSLALDASGNLYGTTNAGGGPNAGTVFRLTPKSGGGYTESVVYRFRGGSDGIGPLYNVLVFDSAGSLYGMTESGGGSTNAGTVYEVTP